MEIIYNDEYLINRAFNKLSLKVKKNNITKPKIEKKNGKTVISNFKKFCDSVKKDQLIVKKYMEDSLRVESNINLVGALIITKGPKPPEIYKTFGDYVKNYIMCQEPKCNSLDTEIIKIDRITFLACNICNSKKSIK
jgi:translation initiation factor 2 subunit 2